MAECTVAILRKGTTIVNIIDAMKAKYTNVNIVSSFEDFFKVTFNDGQESGVSGFYSINIELYLQGKDFTVRDKFIQEIIAELGYSNLKKSLAIFDKYVK